MIRKAFSIICLVYLLRGNRTAGSWLYLCILWISVQIPPHCWGFLGGSATVLDFITSRARLVNACCPFLHHYTEVSHFIQLNWAWDVCWGEEGKINVPPVWSTSARDGWLPNQSLGQLWAVSELLSAAFSGWLTRLWWYFGHGLFLQQCLLCPELWDGRHWPVCFGSQGTL